MRETTKYQPQHDEQRVHFLLRRSLWPDGDLRPSKCFCTQGAVQDDTNLYDARYCQKVSVSKNGEKKIKQLIEKHRKRPPYWCLTATVWSIGISYNCVSWAEAMIVRGLLPF